jgi:hydroxypyruvate isomerase
MRIAANLSLLYAHLPLEARFDAAARDGFRAVEILFPYDRSPAWYADALRASGLAPVLINTPVEEGAGSHGWAARPGDEARFRSGLDRALEVAQTIGCARIHLMAGRTADLPQLLCQSAFTDNLALASARAEQARITLMLEPLNRADVPGYFYHRPEQALAILRTFDSPWLRLQFDFYHCMKEGLVLADELARARGWIGHAQIAGVDGRHEPDLSMHGLQAAVQQLQQQGDSEWLGFEYRPRTTPPAGLAWCEPLLAAGILA